MEGLTNYKNGRCVYCALTTFLISPEGMIPPQTLSCNIMLSNDIKRWGKRLESVVLDVQLSS